MTDPPELLIADIASSKYDGASNASSGAIVVCNFHLES